jgi:3-oxoadipate enol-lactonase
MSGILNYETAGVPAGLTLLLVHPLGSDRGFWSECTELWSHKFRCVAVDLRCAGASPRADNPINVRAHVTDLERLCNYLKLKTVVAIGCALGGTVCASLAANHPERVDALVMANPELRLDEGAKEVLRERAEILLKSGPEKLLPDAVDRIFYGLPHDERYYRYLTSFRQIDPAAHAQSILGFLETDITAEIPHVLCPTLLVMAEHDIVDAVGAVEWITKAIGDRVELARIKQAGHFAPYQAPEAFSTTVVEFIEHRLKRSA